MQNLTTVQITERRMALSSAIFDLVAKLNNKITETNRFIEEVKEAQAAYRACQTPHWRRTQVGRRYTEWMNDWNITIESVADASDILADIPDEPQVP